MLLLRPPVKVENVVKQAGNLGWVLINQGQPLGNRVLGPIAAECRQKRWAKIAALAPKII